MSHDKLFAENEIKVEAEMKLKLEKAAKVISQFLCLIRIRLTLSIFFKHYGEAFIVFLNFFNKNTW